MEYYDIEPCEACDYNPGIREAMDEDSGDILLVCLACYDTEPWLVPVQE